MARKARGLQHAPDIDNNGADRSIPLSYNDLSKCLPDRGGMCERLKQAVLKTRPALVLLLGINSLHRCWLLLFG